jgi:hypothetical protein
VMIIEKPGVNVAFAQGLLNGGEIHNQTVILHELQYGTAAPLALSRDQVVEAGFGCEQPFFEAGPGGPFEPFPFFDRHQNSGLNSAAGNNLRTLLDGRVQELAKARLCILYLP